MKPKKEAANKLCLSCRRSCKQAEMVMINECPRYYQGPKVKRCTWVQLELPLASP